MSQTLPEVLALYPPFTNLPPQQQEIFERLAYEFDDNPLTLYLSPEELAHVTQLGTRTQWAEFLQLEPVKIYIKKEMSQAAQIAARKSFQALEKQAKNGNTQAAKEINELANITGQQDSNRIVVLHQISRPQTQQPPNERGQVQQ